jgi:hypothetical protein
MEPEPVRQFVSKAARCKARAAFELCAPVDLTWQRVKIPDVILNCRLLAPCGLRVHGRLGRSATSAGHGTHRGLS